MAARPVAPVLQAPSTPPPPAAADNASLASRYEAVRAWTEWLCEPLAVEDYQIQSMPDASPVKWHLAHTTWFFETFVLPRVDPGYRPFHPRFAYLFNSYYNAVGERLPRAQRGLISRPTVEEVYRYRAHVDEQMHAVFQEPARAARAVASGRRGLV